MRLKLKLISLFITLMTAAKAEESDTPQGLIPPRYLEPPSEAALDWRSKGENDSSPGSGSTCGACGT